MMNTRSDIPGAQLSILTDVFQIADSIHSIRMLILHRPLTPVLPEYRSLKQIYMSLRIQISVSGWA